eukprot:2629631-Prymnesium_polylepis.1
MIAFLSHDSRTTPRSLTLSDSRNECGSATIIFARKATSRSWAISGAKMPLFVQPSHGLCAARGRHVKCLEPVKHKDVRQEQIFGLFDFEIRPLDSVLAAFPVKEMLRFEALLPARCLEPFEIFKQPAARGEDRRVRDQRRDLKRLGQRRVLTKVLRRDVRVV